MFFLATIADTLKVPPHLFHLGDALSIQSAINLKYPSKTMMDVGLLVTLYDIVRVGSALVHADSGAAHYEVVFRFVVFKPFIGEVMCGRVVGCSKEGIDVSLGFFSDVRIPYYNIFEPNHFDGGRGSWVWDDHQNDGEDAQEPEPDELLELKKGDTVRFVVDKVDFRDRNLTDKTIAHAGEGGGEDGGKKGTAKCVMTITGSIKDDGLGKEEWWREADDDEAGANEEDEDGEEEGGEDEEEDGMEEDEA